MFQMMGVFAEFERSMIRERVMAGLSRARKHGTKTGSAIGRPRIDAATEGAIRAALAAGKGIKKTAAEVGVGTGTVQRNGRKLILSRYTELNANQNLLVKRLNFGLPSQPPPRNRQGSRRALWNSRCSVDFRGVAVGSIHFFRRIA
jgi:Resolvase, N terminal domain